MAEDKKTIEVDASEEVVNAFEAGIVFGRMVENRRPKRAPLWSEDEWLQALIKAVGKKAKSHSSIVECSVSREVQLRHDGEESRKATLRAVKKEMTKPRMAKSAQLAKLGSK
jgi:hypothetical protein